MSRRSHICCRSRMKDSSTEPLTLKTAHALDVKASDFWRRGQTAFFDVRITHVNTPSNQNKNTSTIFRQHEQAKKREYNGKSSGS